MSFIVELSLILVVASLMGILARLLKQPLLVGYIATGFILGPFVLNIISSHNELDIFAKIGISILLFIVGLHLNPDVIKEVGRPAFVIGVGQILFTSLAGFSLLRFLSYDFIPALYISLALTLSSTIIVLKLLSDRGDLDKLHGRIAVGFLLVQDLFAVLFLFFINLVRVDGASGNFLWDNELARQVSRLGLGVLLLCFGLYLISKFILPYLARYLATNQETLFVFSLAWGFGISALFYRLGLSLEVGSLLAGITLAVSPYALEISSRLKPLRDLFVMIFFILLGAQVNFALLADTWSLVLGLSLFVLIGNPLIVYVMMVLFGYRPRTSFLTALAVGQVSEFSLILIALAFSLKQISAEVVSLVTIVAISTLVGSSYLFALADKLYLWLRPNVLRALTWRKFKQEDDFPTNSTEMFIFGYDRIGYDFVQAGESLGVSLAVVDYNPRAVSRLRRSGIKYYYGDAGDIDFLDELNITQASLIVSSIPDFEINKLLVRHYRVINSSGIVIIVARSASEAKALYNLGASYVFIPHYLGGQEAANLITKHGLSQESFNELKEKHLADLTDKENQLRIH